MSDVPDTYYLAYGSNMLPHRIELRLGRCASLGVASLQGYALRFHKRGRDGSGKCDAFETGDAADVLYGVVYTLSETQRELLDDFEGPGYASRDVRVHTSSGVLTAYAYVAKPAHVDARLKPFHWYKSIVEAGARVHDLPEHYVERISATGVLTDPDVERTSQHLAILENFLSGMERR
jgi:gamma-glutamylcyclotransferase